MAEGQGAADGRLLRLSDDALYMLQHALSTSKGSAQLKTCNVV